VARAYIELSRGDVQTISIFPCLNNTCPICRYRLYHPVHQDPTHFPIHFKSLTSSLIMKAHYFENRSTMTPEKALSFLKEGNQRFLNNNSFEHNHLEMITATSESQWPFVAVLSCSDSRVPVELVFDQGLGDVFSVRLAGNVASPNAIGSLEFACKGLGSKLLVVMGHSGCGAVKGACDGIQFGNLQGILDNIKQSVVIETTINNDRTSKNKDFVDRIAALNVQHNIREILVRSEILRDLIISGDVGIIGAMYYIETGKVEFFDEHIHMKDAR
jgi:carbonic anhydrase